MFVSKVIDRDQPIHVDVDNLHTGIINKLSQLDVFTSRIL